MTLQRVRYDVFIKPFGRRQWGVANSNGCRVLTFQRRPNFYPSGWRPFP
jgi:hypothetical protein